MAAETAPGEDPLKRDIVEDIRECSQWFNDAREGCHNSVITIEDDAAHVKTEHEADAEPTMPPASAHSSAAAKAQRKKGTLIPARPKIAAYKSTGGK